MLAHEGNFITDKMPHNFQHVGMILSLFPDAKVIQMRRDPRDVCWSIFTRMFPRGTITPVISSRLRMPMQSLVELMDHWAGISPDE